MYGRELWRCDIRVVVGLEEFTPQLRLIKHILVLRRFAKS